jgi:hypothetical protein
MRLAPRDDLIRALQKPLASDRAMSANQSP